LQGSVIQKTGILKTKRMKKLIFTAVAGTALTLAAQAQTTTRPEKCGMRQFHEAQIAQDPEWKNRLDQQRSSLQANADYYKQYKAQSADQRTTSINAIPVVFHIVVDSAQFLELGGTSGIIKRCDSQIAVLNADFNHQNSDSTSIPSSWKSLYGNVGIQFGLARRDPSGACTPGYEVKIITSTGFSNVNASFPEAKTAGTGLASWDVTKYYNVWCINYTGSAAGLLGLTVPLSSTGSCFGCSPVAQEGVCILYNCLGKNTAGTGTWPTPYDLGRTLTHETGHFFEIWHPWGDDGGQCPTWSSTATITGSGLSTAAGDNGVTCTSGTGYDDGLADTPPESDAVYGAPSYTISGGTTNDCCKMHGSTNTQPIGIACLSYMDYTDDNAMHLFTTDQAAAMASMVLVPSSSGTGATGVGTIGENYNLTQNPTLLVCPTEVKDLELSSSLFVYPNPTNGQINISINSSVENLQSLSVINLLGQEVIAVKGQNQDYYSLNLSGMAKGIYIIKFNFASGSLTRKVILQ
jgi:Secretion system C-terminal sorting domain